MDDQVHLPIGALSQLADDLVVFIDVQLLQVLRGDQLELLQDVDGGAGAVGRGVHCCGRDGPEPRRGGAGLETDVPVEKEEQEGKKVSVCDPVSTQVSL